MSSLGSGTALSTFTCPWVQGCSPRIINSVLNGVFFPYYPHLFQDSQNPLGFGELFIESFEVPHALASTPPTSPSSWSPFQRLRRVRGVKVAVCSSTRTLYIGAICFISKGFEDEAKSLHILTEITE